MATVNLGAIKFNWKGTYNASTAYTIDDVVEYNGSSYICISNSTGNLPTNATYFEQMSAKGTDGTNGTDGTDLTSTLTTQGDILYRDGSGLQRLGAGTSGQALITGGTGANPSWGNVSAISKEFKAYNIASQSVSTNVELKLIYGGEQFDEDNVYDTSTGRYSPNEAGIYFISASLRLSNGSHSDANSQLKIKLNGSTNVLMGGQTYANAYYAFIAVNGLVKLTSSSDYLELWHEQRTNNVSTYANNVEDSSFFSGFKIS